jgi:hypothetical protein
MSEAAEGVCDGSQRGGKDGDIQANLCGGEELRRLRENRRRRRNPFQGQIRQGGNGHQARLPLEIVVGEIRS